MNEYEGDTVFELCSGDNSVSSLAVTVERPIWGSIEKAISDVFRSGGFVRLKVVNPQSSFVVQLFLKSFPGRFKIEALTRSSNPKEEFLEWWESPGSSYRGVTMFGDDECDARTVCTDISIAKDFFKELYDVGDLSTCLLRMRSPWNPMP